MLTNAHKVPGGVEVNVLFQGNDLVAAGVQNGWTEALADRDRTIEGLEAENIELRKALGYTRAALKLLRYSAKRHLGITI